MSSWHSYPKVRALGHSDISALLTEPVAVQEKIDGSQFSFGMFDGQFRCRSRTKDQFPDTDKMFSIAVDQTQGLDLREGWTYSGEYLQRPCHNKIAYERAPTHNVILFDIRAGEELYLLPEPVRQEAERIGLEVVPTFANQLINCVDDVLEFMERESCLGGAKIEGLVFKNYVRRTRAGKVMMGKYVSESFKERMKQKGGGGGKQDLIAMLGESYRTEARWDKAIQHLREDGLLKGTPSDIGALVKEVQRDVNEDAGDQIRAQLFKWAWRQIERRIVAGLPEYYKRLLMEKAFDEEDSV